MVVAVIWLAMILLPGAAAVERANEVDILNILLPIAHRSDSWAPVQLISTKGDRCYSWESSDPSIVSVRGHP